MQCPECDTEVREFEWHCPACNHDCGYPNVRAAQKQEEQKELAQRVQEVETKAASRGRTAILDQFRQAMNDSQAVLCRSFGKTQELVSDDNEIYATFYQLVGAGNRRPEDTQIERDRLIADDLLFPHYRQHIRFAALSLDGQGVGHYGGCSIVFKEIAIRRRATVFEENSLYFCEVHIYGPLHRRSIERVVSQKPTPKADRIILRNLKRVLSEVGATLE